MGALILNRRREMLLVRSQKWGNRYTIAGGHVEAGESLVSALRREIKEEVGLEIRRIRLLTVQEAIFSTEFWKPRHFIFFDFVCTASGGTPTADLKEIQEVLWVKPGRALAMNLDGFTRRMVEVFVAQDRSGKAGEVRLYEPSARSSCRKRHQRTASD